MISLRQRDCPPEKPQTLTSLRPLRLFTMTFYIRKLGTSVQQTSIKVRFCLYVSKQVYMHLQKWEVKETQKKPPVGTRGWTCWTWANSSCKVMRNQSAWWGNVILTGFSRSSIWTIKRTVMLWLKVVLEEKDGAEKINKKDNSTLYVEVHLYAGCWCTLHKDENLLHHVSLTNVNNKSYCLIDCLKNKSDIVNETTTSYDSNWINVRYESIYNSQYKGLRS